jgi:hypothetical protein
MSGDRPNHHRCRVMGASAWNCVRAHSGRSRQYNGGNNFSQSLDEARNTHSPKLTLRIVDMTEVVLP